jgi:hypothetical protein
MKEDEKLFLEAVSGQIVWTSRNSQVRPKDSQRLAIDPSKFANCP